jgi:hypothetical protein
MHGGDGRDCGGLFPLVAFVFPFPFAFVFAFAFAFAFAKT